MENQKFVDLVATYGRAGTSKVDTFKRAAIERPYLYRAYDMQVRHGRKVSVTEAAPRLDE